MRTRSVFSCALLAASQADAFATLNLANAAASGQILDRRQSPSATPPFDAKQQLVSVSGIHKFQAPGPLDMRGPCPGLNAMANHGYLPRIGLATIDEFVSGTHDAFGMAFDLATILAAYGSALDGLGAAWSIGGVVHVGIGGSHNNYESDNSPLRGDLNQYGNSNNLVMSQFMELYNMQPKAATANYNLDVLKEFRGRRFNESIAKNPNFYFAPFSGAVVTQAAYTFIYRFMANKTAEHPTGVLNKEVLKSFMSIKGPEHNLRWVPGHERIPENWYRRNDKDLYSINYFESDISYLKKGQEYITQAGCNQGRVNSFVAINASDVSAGAYGPAKALEDPLCYGLAYATALAAQSPLGPVVNVVDELILPIQNSLNCITIPAVNKSASAACPGYSLYGGPTGPVAKGAIQN